MIPPNKQLPSPGITLVETGVVTDSSTVDGDSVSIVEAADCGTVLWLDAEEVEDSMGDWVVSLSGISVSTSPESVEDSVVGWVADKSGRLVEEASGSTVVSCWPAEESVPGASVWADPVVDESSREASVADSAVDCDPADGDPAGMEETVAISCGS